MPPPFRPANDAHPPSATGLLVVSSIVVLFLAYAGFLYVVFGVLKWH